MSPRSLQKAFTLTEVLMAAGILAIGFMLIATIFPVGLKLTTMATERTVAAVVIDEALAKIRIFGVDPNLPDSMVYFDSDVSDGYNRLYTKFANLGYPPPPIEDAVVDFVHLYPSTDINTGDKKYSWAALLRWIDSQNAQVIIFVSRKTNTSSQYHKPERDLTDPDYGRAILTTPIPYIDWPVPVRVEVTDPAGSGNTLQIDDPDEVSFINKGTEIVDDENGERYTVLERRGTNNDEIVLDRDWIDEGAPNPSMWVVPPAAGAAGSSCITIFQTTITF